VEGILKSYAVVTASCRTLSNLEEEGEDGDEDGLVFLSQVQFMFLISAVQLHVTSMYSSDSNEKYPAYFQGLNSALKINFSKFWQHVESFLGRLQAAHEDQGYGFLNNCSLPSRSEDNLVFVRGNK
jgi:hypothetical protein